MSRGISIDTLVGNKSILFEIREVIMSSPSLQGSFRPMREHAEAMSPLKPSKSRFSSLLADASNQIRKEQDEKVAVQYQMNEAYQIASEWAQEETGNMFSL